MNRDQKAAAIAEIAERDPRVRGGLRRRLPRHLRAAGGRAAHASCATPTRRFRVVKNTLTERAADEAGAEALKALLEGPTALTFVRGDAAAAAKAIADYAQGHRPAALQGRAHGRRGARRRRRSRRSPGCPSREVLYGQLVGIVASPITGLARGAERAASGRGDRARPGQREEARPGEIPAGERRAARGAGRRGRGRGPPPRRRPQPRRAPPRRRRAAEAEHRRGAADAEHRAEAAAERTPTTDH